MVHYQNYLRLRFQICPEGRRLRAHAAGLLRAVLLSLLLAGGITSGAPAQETATSVTAASVTVSAASGEAEVNKLFSDNPRLIALEVFSSLKRRDPPASLALRLAHMVRLYRYDCARVTNYQIYEDYQNRADLKVKCAGALIYGLTVASNGYGAVYGGNGLIAALDRRDGLILTFDATGRLADTSARTVSDLKQETLGRTGLGDDLGQDIGRIVYYFLMALVGVVFGLICLYWGNRLLEKYRRRQRRRLRQQRRSRTGDGASGVTSGGKKRLGELTSDVKDRLEADCTRIAHRLYFHKSGLYLARDKTGKRRVFRRKIWALLYRAYGLRLFEVYRVEDV